MSKLSTKYYNDYQKKHYKRCIIMIRNDDDLVIRMLNDVENKSEYIRRLIREDAKKHYGIK